MPDQPALPVAAREAILAWYAEHGRELAFRRTTDPYAILVSEAMAQQTQAARAAAYWERFMVAFPTVEALAAASPADVLRAWAGLGYDRRAIALRRAARVIVDAHAGVVPASVEDLDALPGIGPYTARAVAALAFGVPVGAVDVNVRRVIGRIVAGASDALSQVLMQTVADAAVPVERPDAWTHAVMDVGATLCRPRAPRCDECPARPWCRFASATAADGAAPPPAQRDGAATAIRRTRQRQVPFASTNRWLRGRILDRLRAVDGDAWISIDGGIGAHDQERVRAAVRAMAADGVVELEARDDHLLRARLPLG